MSKMRCERNSFSDFVVFLDDNDQRREVYCKVLEINSFVTFELTSGKVLTLPPSRILKIKQQGGEQ